LNFLPAPTRRSEDTATACFTRNFGYGQVVKIDGNKLTIAFEKAGEKKVVDSFVERV
jgi:DNA helicase II / ATP-dependent DNA helicase PcrA